MSTVNFNQLDAAVVPYVSEPSPESAFLISALPPKILCKIFDKLPVTERVAVQKVCQAWCKAWREAQDALKLVTSDKSVAILSDFPPEILSEIFEKLPVTQMPAIRSMCRAWYSVMQDGALLSKMYKNIPNPCRVLLGDRSHSINFDVHPNLWFNEYPNLWIALMQNRNFMHRIATPAPVLSIRDPTIKTYPTAEAHRESVEMLSRVKRIRVRVLCDVGFGNHIELRGGDYLAANPEQSAMVLIDDRYLTLRMGIRCLGWYDGRAMVNRNAETWVLGMDLWGLPGDTMEVKALKVVPDLDDPYRRYELPSDSFASVTFSGPRRYWAEGANTQLTFTGEDQVITIRSTTFESESTEEKAVLTRGYIRARM